MNYFTEADFNKLWQAETDERSTLPFPTDKELIALEKRLGVKLPASYIELAANSQNGGYLKRNGVPIRDESGNVFRHVKISYINPIGR
ncbi:MAG: SMI1/KNR4 family protein, partial [Sporomusaceae bacterium]|nr:SMI1/KNR4 family protein [Sporomusaceae bacterium]